MTKKITLALIISFVFNVAVRADEGMWLPMLLGQQVYDDMVKKGLKLTKEQLYDINKPSVKDAIVIFGGGCTGEIVSNEGLIFTNHHCGYEAIAKASSVEHNYLRDGFWAKSKAEEIPSDNLSVQFLVRIDDVTDKVNEAAKGLTEADYLKKLPDILTEMGKKLTEGTTYEGRVVPFFKGNQFLLFVYERFK
ncbi:MAG TPA: S46 family peptidase, partial [Bacteroidia bacterium]|nr:S46 family peptidase [Bacteroidia bacterium]